MKNKEKVAELIAALKAEAENEFELHRISVLEKDLLEGEPKIEIIDEKHQEFNGIVFVKRSDGHYNYPLRLHQAVYMYHFGEIPEGIHIHHKDIDPSNNEISNLQLMTNSDHHKLHQKLYKKEKVIYECVNCGQKFEGLKHMKRRFCNRRCYANWLNKLGKLRKYEIRVCEFCHKNYKTRADSKQKYCSRECVNKATKAGLIIRRKESFVCINCGKIFEAVKGGNNKFCSTSCNDKWRRKDKNHQEIRKCVVCGKEFSIYKYSKTKVCSLSCSAKMRWSRRKQEK